MATTAIDDDAPPSLPEKILISLKKCLGLFVKSAPLEPGEEAQELIDSLNMTAKHMHQLYVAFHALRQLEVPNAIVTSASEVECDTLIHLVDNRKKWVRKLLRHIVEYGGCPETIDWDHFLYIFLRFCSLSKNELCQVLFFIIVKDCKTPQVNYLTEEQLLEYYDQFANCPIKAFNTGHINFLDMPLSRYYVSDFCELASRFSQLLNPILHLQRQLQAKLPSQSFWDNNDRADSYNRKLGLEFFMIQKVHVYLRGEPPFRESCDMLLPDALGAEPVKSNIPQWRQRVPHVPSPFKVWGNQEMPAPDLEVDQIAKPGTTYAPPKSPVSPGSPASHGAHPGGPVSPVSATGQGMQPLNMTNLAIPGQAGQSMQPGQMMQSGQMMPSGQPMQPGQMMQSGQMMQPGQQLPPGQAMYPGQSTSPAQPGQTMLPGQQLGGPPIPTNVGQPAVGQPGSPQHMAQLGAQSQLGQSGAPMQPGQPGFSPQVPGQPTSLGSLPGIPGSSPAAAQSQQGMYAPAGLSTTNLPAGPGGPIPTSPMGAATVGTGMVSPSAYGMQKASVTQQGIIETDAPDGDLNQVPGWLRDYVTIPVKPKVRRPRREHSHGGHFRQTF